MQTTSRTLAAVLTLLCALSAQTGGKAGEARPAPKARTGLGPVDFDGNGWPVEGAVAEPGVLPAAGTAAPRPMASPMPAAETARRPAEVDASHVAPGAAMPLDAPLLDVFRATRSPAAFQQLGGVVAWWRLTVHGDHGEVIGVREITHTADCKRAECDRLDHDDGRSFGRLGGQLFAERSGMPWSTLEATAGPELLLFGTQLRMPWCFADSATFAAVQRDVVERNGERFARVAFERRPPPALDIAGPVAMPEPRDRFELWYEPSSGLVRELVHRFAASRQQRRVVLEDWRDVGGVRMPFRRVYVDESLRPTTTLELLRIEQRRVTDRDFRLH